jgi:transposase-like protein
MIAERDVIVCHTTIMRWVLRFAPERVSMGSLFQTSG